jgi:hypothetical protein
LAFERSQDEKQRMREEVAELYQELERHSAIAPSSKKRKKDSSSVTKANTQSKRIRLPDEIENDCGSNNDDFGTEQHLGKTLSSCVREAR